MALAEALPADRMDVAVGRGEPWPLGLRETADGCNFAVFSGNAWAVTLLLFDGLEPEVWRRIVLDPHENRTGDVWHIHLRGNLRGRSYLLRVDGPWRPDEGHRFDARIPLLDPYAPALVGSAPWQNENPYCGRMDGASRRFARCLIDGDRFDWQNDRPPHHAWQDTVIYETHIRSLTCHASSRAHSSGQYAGVVEKIPYFTRLGITAIELMPVQEFPEWETNQRTGKPLRNYWGYNPVALFAPKGSYSSCSSINAAVVEFKTMVRELHRAGIEVILDVVFNHTAEGNETGPTFSFRGLDNSVYYLLAHDRRRYLDYTGCGNTLNCNHPVVRSLIIDCLRHWVGTFHIDGFRFDLASILGRDSEGRLLSNPPLLEQIVEDPLLRNVKLIAEAWDLGGAFQVGRFPGRRWAEWNCCFRDDVRRFWRGDPGMTGAFATRICGSADLYQVQGETPLNSINFVTCHDGFTLNDLVSYARKHNEANGEDNRDGIAENYSENNGVEGVSDDPEIERMRLRQIKNMLVSLLVSRGVAMLLGGDEFRRTQEGNNNAYCQDNEISWYDWRLAEANAGLLRFVTGMIALRKAHPVLRAERFYADAEIRWLGVDGGKPEWHAQENRIGCVIVEQDRAASSALCLLFNAALRPCRFMLPACLNRTWRVAVDTAQASPADLPEPGSERTVSDEVVLLERSAMVLTCL
jgi:isoamylase